MNDFCLQDSRKLWSLLLRIAHKQYSQCKRTYNVKISNNNLSQECEFI